MLLPEMIQKTDSIDPKKPQLSRQYVSIVEVGGFHAHLFFDLIAFLEIPTLIITDIDAVSLQGQRWKACQVAAGTRTSNACLRKWFGDGHISAAALLAQPDASKIKVKRRIAFEVPEDAASPCGRSFEDAFVLANTDLFKLGALKGAALATAAYEAAEDINKKTDFALHHLLRKTDWNVPRYISEGLRWLADTEAAPVA